MTNMMTVTVDRHRAVTQRAAVAVACGIPRLHVHQLNAYAL